MNSPAPKKPTTTNNNLPAQLKQIGLCALPTQLDDFIARVTKSRCSAHQILEQLAQAETAERSRRSLERRLRISGIKRFKPMADFDWSWPAKIERDIIERALTLDFLGEARNLILVGRNGLGKTMIAQNIAHAAVLAGHTVLFRSAARCSKNCTGSLRKAAAANCAATPMLDFCASMRSGIYPSTTRRPTCFTKSSTGVTNASQ